MGRLVNKIGGAALAVSMFVVSVVAFAAAVGLIFPVVHSYCLESRSITHPKITSRWEFNWIGDGFPDPAPDTENCVRNTPTREALSALGIWKLGTPEHQIAANVLE